MIFNTKIEKNDTKEIINSEYVNFDFFKNSTVLITGATGLIGKQVVSALLYANEVKNTNITVVALVRNKKKAKDIFDKNKTNKLKFVVQDITRPLKTKLRVDYIIHTANSTSSKSFVEKPVETINSIVQGTKNILDFAKKKEVKSVVYLSSMEVFGNTDTERVEPLKETDYGYIDLAKVRNSYPEGKRLAEAMCVSYFKEYNLPVKIARLAQTIGAGVDYNDGRIFAEFARCIVEKRDITLKTEGKTVRSYLYVTDCVSAVLSMLEKGKNGEIYNVANSDTTCSIKEMAEMLCKTYKSTNLVFNIDDKYYPDTTKYYLDTTKYFLDTTWQAKVDLKEMFKRLIANFRNHKINSNNFTLQNNFLQTIFSAKNIGLNKFITILGFTFKIDKTKFFNKKYGNFKIQSNKIVVNNFSGNGYGCNPKYIIEEILRRNLPYEIFWMCKEENLKDVSFPKEVKKIKNNGKKCIEDFSSAKLIISNVHCNKYISKGWIKKENQKYIQTWHGSLGIKKIDYSVENANNKFFSNAWHSLTNLDLGYTDYLISNSNFEENVFKNGLDWFEDFCKFGHPRNDIFFWNDERKEQIKNKIFSVYNIDLNKKVLLYAPSYRDNGDLGCYNLNIENLLLTLSEQTNQEWVIMVRLHPNASKFSTKLYNFDDKKIFDVTKYSDIQELLVSVDSMITDYSSCIFDFMLSRKPAFIFATDIEDYNTERGFYYPLESTPFPVAPNNEQLIKNIKNFDYEKYKNEVEQFLKDKGCMEDGHASERVVDLIEGIMNE